MGRLPHWPNLSVIAGSLCQGVPQAEDLPDTADSVAAVGLSGGGLMPRRHLEIGSRRLRSERRLLGQRAKHL